MNLGELIVSLSLDSADFNRSLEKAKSSAVKAASDIEKTFDKISLEINVDDDQLYKLNKHLDLKYQHYKQLNNYFSDNPLTPTVDESELTRLNKTLHQLTHKDHVVNVTQKVDVEIKNESKNDISEAVEEGVVKGFEQAKDKISEIVANAIKSSSSSNSGSPENGSADLINAIQSGFKSIADATGQSALDKATEVILKPGADLLTGFMEGISHGFATEMSKGMQQSLKKISGISMEDVGENVTNRFLHGKKTSKAKRKNNNNNNSTNTGFLCYLFWHFR